MLKKLFILVVALGMFSSCSRKTLLPTYRFEVYQYQDSTSKEWKTIYILSK